jgi:hypothetical protein
MKSRCPVPLRIGVVSLLVVHAVALSSRWPGSKPGDFDQGLTSRGPEKSASSAEGRPWERDASFLPAPSSKLKPPTNIIVCKHVHEAPAWTVGYGKEFWRWPNPERLRFPPSRKATEAALVLPASVNLGDVIERVSHALESNSTSGTPRVQTWTYTARFDGAGLRLSPHRMECEFGAALVHDPLLLTPTDEPGASPRHAIDEPDWPGSTPAFPQPEPALEARFRTESIIQGGRELYAAEGISPPWSVLGNTAQALLNPELGLIEHYETRAAGVAVTWVLTQPPRESGAVTVEAALTGLTYAGQTEAGHHFADATGVARLRVGLVTIVDAANRSWHVATDATESPEGARLRVEVPAAILAQATYPLAIDPVISPEFGMDEPVFAPRAATELFSPAIASNGGDYLVVWATRAFGLYGSRVTSSGLVVDIMPIMINRTGADHRKPVVACNGGDYLVVWEDDRNRYTTGPDIFATRVSADGRVADTNGAPIIVASGAQWRPAVAGNGDEYLVVWEDGDVFTNSIVAARVGADGRVISANLTIREPTTFHSNPAVAANGSNYLVVWSDVRNPATVADIYGSRVTGSGAVVDPGGVPICLAREPQLNPSVAANGDNYLVVWSDRRPEGSVFAARVQSDGTVVETNGFAISRFASLFDAPVVAAKGSEFFVVWSDWRNAADFTESDLYGARVSGNGALLDTNGIWLTWASDTESLPGIAANRDGYLTVWQPARGDGWDVFGTRITPSGTVLDGLNGFPISGAANAETTPAVAFNGTEYLVAWADNRNFGSDIYGVLVNDSGIVVNPSGLAISQAPGSQTNPAIAACGTNFLVVWRDERNFWPDIFAARVSGFGVVMETNGFAIAAGPRARFPIRRDNPAVASDGTNCLVVWQSLGSSAWDIL